MGGLDSVIEGYKAIWSTGRYAGFSQGTSGERTTPLLDELIERLSNQRNGLPVRVIEGGAGCGSHSIRLAEQDNFHVVAVESSEVAAGIIKDNLKKAAIGDGAALRVVNGDIIQYLKGLGAGQYDAFYANAVFHFFPPKERAEAYGLLHAVLTQRGLIAISFKAIGDALEKEGAMLEEQEPGSLVRGYIDGITRLFVSRPERIVEELQAARYNVKGIFKWTVSDYNPDPSIKRRDGEFVGFIAEKAQR